MVPASVRTAFILLVGCLFACYLGSSLPDYEMVGAYVLLLAIVCTICAVVNNMPMLLAFGIWYPFAPPIPFFSSFPTFALVLGWIAAVKFFRLCLSGTLRYVSSVNPLILICFAWVPARFILSPVHKLGATVAGGSGVSGLNSYFAYFLAGVTVISAGLILNTRDRIVSFLVWSYRVCLVTGLFLLVCAFIPSSQPFLASMGMFAAGNLEDGIQRIVALPGYGSFLVIASLCPALFGFSRQKAIGIFVLGLAMMIIGGNRGSMTAVMMALPIILLLRKQRGALIFSVVSIGFFSLFMHLWVDQMDISDINPLTRSFGVLDSKIDDASGGSASADWRYAVWRSGLEKIAEHPIIGKGFGNLDQRVDPSDARRGDSTDFDVVLAGGEAHNGFIVAAYGFGIPFMLGLTYILLSRMVSHSVSALRADPHDPQLRDLHAYLGCQFATTTVIVYTAIDLAVPALWIAIGMGIVLDRVTKAANRQSGPPVLPAQIKPRFEQMVGSARY